MKENNSEKGVNFLILFSDNSIRDIIDIYNNIQQQINYMDVIDAKILIKHLGQWIGRMEDKKWQQ